MVLVFGNWGIKFRWMESALFRTCWGLSFRIFGGSMSGERLWVTTIPACFWLWDIVGFSSGGWNLVSSGPNCGSVLRHCGVKFRLTGYGSPQDPRGFGFGTSRSSLHFERRWVTTGSMLFQLWGIVAFCSGDGIWSPQYLLRVQLRDILGFSSGSQELEHHGPMGFRFWRCGAQFRLMESGLFRTCWGLSFGHCRVPFRLIGDGSPQDPCVFGFGVLCNLVQSDGILSL